MGDRYREHTLRKPTITMNGYTKLYDKVIMP